MAEIKVEILRGRAAVEACGGGRLWVAAAAAAAAEAEEAEVEGGIITYQNNVRRGKNVILKTKMNQCPICYQSFSRSDVMLRHKRNVFEL